MGIAWAFENIKATWLIERPQFALWLPVFMGVGIAAYFSLQSEPTPYIGAAAVILATLLLATAKADFLRVFAAAAIALSAGFTCAELRTADVRAPVIDGRTGPISIIATIERIERGENGGRLILTELGLLSRRSLVTPDKARVSIKGAPEKLNHLLPGDRVKMTASLRPSPPPTMPGSFDFQRHAFFQGIGAYGFILGGIEKIEAPVPVPSNTRKSLSRKIETLRLFISTTIHELQPGNAGAVAAALLTGHRGYIPEATLAIMRDAGIAHLLAISGLHIGLVAGLVFAAVRVLCALIPVIGLRINGKKAAALFAFFAALGYAVLAGFTVPTERAFLMTGLMLAGVIIDRRALSMRSVCWAAAVVLMFRPESLVSPGFQMSFAAVVALVAAYSAIAERRLQNASRAGEGVTARTWRYFGGVFLTTVVASAATSPFAIYHFQHASAFGLIANAIAVPLAAFWVMPAGIVTLGAMTVGWEGYPLAAMCTGIRLILGSAGFIAEQPGAAVDIAAPPLWSLCLITLAGLWLAIWRHRWRLLALPFIAIGLSGPFFAVPPDIIINGDARLVAVLTEKRELLTSTSRAARFEAKNWQRRIGTTARAHSWARDAENLQGRLRCDNQGCTMRHGTRLIAISQSESTLSDDCRRSWMLLATVPVRHNCRPPWGVIDRFDLWRYGTHAITFTDNGPIIRTVNGERGRRPWVIRPD